MKVFDCFRFFNEFDILNLRLHELNDVVDYFVLLESKITFSGKLKFLFFDNNKEIFSEFSDKIIHIIYEDNLGNISGREREEIHLNFIYEALSEINVNDDDILLISDADEIFKHQRVSEMRDGMVILPTRCQMNTYYYYLNNFCPDQSPNNRAYAIKWCQIRHTLSHYRYNGDIYRDCEDCGWHFSYLGGPSAISDKISSFAHTEYNITEINNPSWLNEVLEHPDKDLFWRDLKYIIDNDFSKLPDFINQNIQQYNKYIFKNGKYIE